MRNVVPFKSSWGRQNLPDDWGMYFVKCNRCGKQYHKSEYGCSCEDEQEEEKDDEGQYRETKEFI